MYVLLCCWRDGPMFLSSLILPLYFLPSSPFFRFSCRRGPVFVKKKFSSKKPDHFKRWFFPYCPSPETCLVSRFLRSLPLSFPSTPFTCRDPSFHSTVSFRFWTHFLYRHWRSYSPWHISALRLHIEFFDRTFCGPEGPVMSLNRLSLSYLGSCHTPMCPVLLPSSDYASTFRCD